MGPCVMAVASCVTSTPQRRAGGGPRHPGQTGGVCEVDVWSLGVPNIQCLEEQRLGGSDPRPQLSVGRHLHL